MRVSVSVSEEIDMAPGELPLAEQTNALVIEAFPSPGFVQLSQQVEPIGNGDMIGFPFHTDKFVCDGPIVSRDNGKASGQAKT